MRGLARSPRTLGGVRFRERLSVPLSWWVLQTLFALSMIAAVGLYVGPVWGIGVGLACFGVMAAVFSAASTLVTVSDTELRVGRAVLELAYVSECVALDQQATRHRGGPGANARAHLVLRPYVPTAVEVTLDDPADPVPYWLLGTRRPTDLAAAVTAALAVGEPA